MPELLLDSSILIDVLRNHPRAKTYLRRVSHAGTGAIHAASVAEIVVGTLDGADLRKALDLLRQFPWIHALEADSETTLTRFISLHLAQQIEYRDCVIAATALRLDMPVATTNDKHFRPIPGLQLIRPY